VHDLALITNLFYRCSDLHVSLLSDIRTAGGLSRLEFFFNLVIG
jgi:hypothetical protein